MISSVPLARSVLLMLMSPNELTQSWSKILKWITVLYLLYSVCVEVMAINLTEYEKKQCVCPVWGHVTWQSW